MNYKRGLLIGLFFGIIALILTILMWAIPLLVLIIIALIFSWWYFKGIGIQRGFVQGLILGILFVFILVILHIGVIFLLKSLLMQQFAVGGDIAATSIGQITQLVNIDYPSVFQIAQLISYLAIIISSVIISLTKKDKSSNQNSNL